MMERILYTAPFLIYFPRLISNYETQPFIFLALCCIGVLFGKRRRDNILPISVIAAFAAVFAIASNWQNDLNGSNFAGTWIFLLGPTYMFGLIGFRLPVPSRAFVAGITCVFGLIYLFEAILPDTYVTISEALLTRTNISNSIRGSAFLTPEPSYAVGSLVYLLVLGRFSALQHGWSQRWVEFCVFSYLALTFSTLAVLFAGLFAFVRWPLFSAVGATILVAVVKSVGYLALGNDEGVRAVVALSRLLTVEPNDFIYSLNAVDASLSARIISNYAGFATPAYYPMGLGLDCQSLLQAISTMRMTAAYQNEALMYQMNNGCLYPAAYMPALVLATGWIGLSAIAFLVCLTVFVLRDRSKLQYDSYPILAAVVMLLLQSQISNPIPWVLLYLGLFGRVAPDARVIYADLSPKPRAAHTPTIKIYRNLI
jgi:hypothetical protein